MNKTGGKKLKTYYKILVSIFCLAGLGGISWLNSRPQASLVPVYSETMGNFEFVDQDGKIFKTSNMTGHVWLVNFFFTSCAGPCPIMNAQIAGVLKKVPTLHALSITTDPNTDTSDHLKEYAQSIHADQSRWKMVHGSPETSKQFGEKTLRLPVGSTADAHSPRIVLLDKKGQIRGWYDSQDPRLREILLEAIEAIQKDITSASR